MNTNTSISRVAYALGHPCRVAIVRRLKERGELSCNEAIEGLARSYRTRRRQVAILRRFGVVIGKKDPTRHPHAVYLTLNTDALAAFAALAA